jgi:thiol-disulfide isomerase/thioredoxin
LANDKLNPPAGSSDDAAGSPPLLASVYAWPDAHGPASIDLAVVSTYPGVALIRVAWGEVMTFLVVVVAIFGVVCLLNLAMMVGVIRRLREHSAHLKRLLEVVGPQEVMAPVGTQAGSFATTTIAGESLSSSDLAGGTLVGFFSPGCGGCTEQMPRLIEYAQSAPGGRQQIVAVIVADDGDAGAAFDLAKLGAVAQVVVEASGGAMSKAFQVQAYPALCLVAQDRTITASGPDIAMFQELSREDAHAG